MQALGVTEREWARAGLALGVPVAFVARIGKGRPAISALELLRPASELKGEVDRPSPFAPALLAYQTMLLTVRDTVAVPVRPNAVEIV